MEETRSPLVVATLTLCLAASAALAAPAAEGDAMKETAPQVTVRPQETDEILANPSVGWETFHCTKDRDKHLPSWIPSTIQYARWGWGELEPKPGQLNAEFLDAQLADSRRAGQRLAFRVMCCSSGPGHPYQPAWLAKEGGREVPCSYGQTKGLLVPDFDHPATLEKHLDFIRRLGERYDGHADLDHVDLGSVGWWGEWHMSDCKEVGMPTAANCRKIVDAYLAAFRKTPLIMLIGGKEQLTYATQHGAGWRADCLGDLGGFSKSWCHMRKGYPVYIREAGVQDAWKTAPVAWESCWDMRRWVKEGWPLRFIFNYALALHGSYLNNKSAPLPEDPIVRPETERFLRRLGYRLVLKELTHPAAASPGGKCPLAMKWQNAGSAPCYRPYRLAYRLTPAGAAGSAGARTLVGGVTVKGWLPGSVELFTNEFFGGDWDLPKGPVVAVADEVALPADLPAGKYALSIAVVAEDAPTPAIRLPLPGRDGEGWYPISELDIRR
jgi:hypothetical protein